MSRVASKRTWGGRLLLAVLSASICLGGCGFVELRIPSEFKGKKQVEDPPLSQCPRRQAVQHA